MDSKKITLIAFRDGSYKKLADVVEWKHSQWMHFTLASGDVVRVNPANVNYIQEMTEKAGGERPTMVEPSRTERDVVEEPEQVIGDRDAARTGD